MMYIDMHCDTIGKILDSEEREDLKDNPFQISIPKMRKGHVLAQFFACFTCPKDDEAGDGYEGCWERALRMMGCLDGQIEKFPEDLSYAMCHQDIRRNEKDGKISVFPTIEEGGILCGRMERLEELYRRGIRLMTLLWNYENCLGHPNSRDAKLMEKGLTPFGMEVVEWMGEKGMIVDVSHASDGTFRDVLRQAKGPVVASHSNCRALCSHPRNLTDEMIRALAEKGGIAGLNFYGNFLGSSEKSCVSEMTEHLLHMLGAGGSDFPAIGTDFDGIPEEAVYEINGPDEMEKLWSALKKEGISESQLDKIWHGNALRVIQMLP